MIELIIITILAFIILKGIPILRQIDEDYTKKYNKKNKWKENITQHFNGHHQNYGYQDYKYDEYEDY